MEPITHIASGALVGQSLRSRYPGRMILFFCILAAWIPDIDNLAGFVSPEFYLLFHRGITHSIVGGLGVAAILAGLFRLFSRNIPFREYFAIAYGCVLLHIFLDVITSYGTMILSPFTNTRFSIHAVYIVDPIYTPIAAILLILSFFLKRRRTAFAIAGLVWIFVYPMTNYAIKGTVERSVTAQLNKQQIAYSKVHVTADMLAPIYWKVVVENGGEYGVESLNILHLNGPLKLERFQKADPKLMNKLGKQASMFKTYAWFSLYPIMKESNTKEGEKITFGDLRFYVSNPIGKKILNNREMPFTLIAYLNGKGKLTKYVYLRPGRVKFEQHFQ